MANRGNPVCVAKLLGSDLIGMEIVAPLSSYPKVYVLPLFTIAMDKVLYLFLYLFDLDHWSCNLCTF